MGRQRLLKYILLLQCAFISIRDLYLSEHRSRNKVPKNEEDGLATTSDIMNETTKTDLIDDGNTNERNATSVTIPSSLEDLIRMVNISTRKVGNYKAFYLQNAPNDHLGWLIAYNQIYQENNQHTVHKAMNRAWTIAQEAQNTHGISHLYVNPPILFSSPDQNGGGGLDPMLSSSFSSLVDILKIPNNFAHNYSGIVAQKCRVSPKPSNMLRIVRKPQKANRQLEEFIREHVHRTRIAEFALEMQNDIDKTKQMLERYPGLRYDFQVYVDSNGRMFHYDFDRFFQIKESDYFDNVTIQAMDRRLDQFVQTAWTLATNTSNQSVG